MSDRSDTPDTFARLLVHHGRVRGDKPAMREKDLGIWQTWTWSEAAAEVEVIANGLAALGFRPGQSLAIIGDNRPRLYWAMTAAQVLGGFPVPLYQDSVAQEMIHVLADAEVEFALAEDQEQVDKLLEILPQCPRLKRIIYDDPRGLANYVRPEILSYAALVERGREFAQSNPRHFGESVAAGRTDDIAVMLYTSGTTGMPKGVSHTHAALIHTAGVLCEFDGLTDADSILSYLPMAWVGDFLYSYAQSLRCGLTLNCPESPETVLTDMREIGPSFYFAPPRIYEGILTQVMIRMEDASWVKRRLFHAFMELGRRVGGRLLDGARVGALDRLLYAVGDLLVYGPLKNVLGLSRLRAAYTGGEAIGPDLFEFYRSLRVNLKQLYGMTETCVTVCMHPSGRVRLDTVGPPMPGVDVRIADSGEILVRSPGMMLGYHKNPGATAEAIDAEGWFHTGDAGYFDGDGHLKVIDRARDVGKLADGTLFAPKYLENKLKFFPHIKEAVAFGAGSDCVTALINIDLASVGNWAEKRGLAYTGYADLAARAEVHALVGECVARVNRDLAADPHLANAQIRRFLVLHKELDADDGELTRTMKVRRGLIAERYAPLTQALYDGSKTADVATQVTFEDGRKGTLSARVAIRDATTWPVPAKAMEKAA